MATALALLAGAAAGATTLPLHTCRLAGLEHDAQCGVLERPLDPARPAGTQIGLHVVVIPALARQKLPDPIFFFAGGPGQSAVGLAGTIERLTARLGARRDLVLIDQRGTGHSAPLHCDVPTAEESLARALDRTRAIAALDACRRSLQQLPWGDLRFYTTSIAMADADAVRSALGAAQVDLIGISYGTRAALEYLRVYPTHVRRVVIDGVAPPDMVLPESEEVDAQAALAALLRDCAAEKACKQAHPALAQTWQGLLASLPKTVDFTGPVVGHVQRVTLTREALRGLIRPGLYSPALGALLPYAIEQAAAGRYDPLMALAAGDVDIAEGEHFSVVCAEDVPRMGRAGVAEGEQDTPAMYRAACANWPRGEVPSAFYTIPPSRVPVLLLSGGLDPVTPPRHAERAAKALGPNARAVVVPNNGHNVTAIACMRDAVFHFIDAASDSEARAVDMGCAAKVPRPLAFEPPQPARARPADNDPKRFDDATPPPADAPAPAREEAR